MEGAVTDIWATIFHYYVSIDDATTDKPKGDFRFIVKI